ncbi:MAG: hypothetical protein JJU26_12915 [Oceanicaulis sp.]|uniref:hypothetical protein n=1 Tax=Glycocaulis sp. TaxID=1969725 RepID=UPI0025C06C2E|nr:hypothetical protein [Glycocaulis sp.]MCC5982606.1 hypothetical protein [Oceanicaulis sp.]MCH8522399.1 hypothetical protein [Glycocaulis sp.]
MAVPPVLAASSQIIKAADQAAYSRAAINPDHLIQAAARETRAAGIHDTHLETALHTLIDRGYLRHSSEETGQLVTDRTQRWTDSFARALTHPAHTNTQISEHIMRSGQFNRADPLSQPQRYTIIDISLSGGMDATLRALTEPRIKSTLIEPDHTHQSTLHPRVESQTITGWLRNAVQSIHRIDRNAIPSSQSVLFVRADALQSAHRALALTSAADKLHIPKVIILADPSRDRPADLPAVMAAIRAGAVSTLSAPARFNEPRHSENLSSRLLNAGPRLIDARGETAFMAAARLAESETRQLYAATPDHARQLDLAAAHNGQTYRSGAATLTQLYPISAHLADTRTGAGLRADDVLRLDTGRDGDRPTQFTLKSLDPLTGHLVVQDQGGKLATFNLNTLHDQGVRIQAFSTEKLPIKPGDPTRFHQSGSQIPAVIRSVSSEGISIRTDTGRDLTLTSAQAHQALTLDHTSSRIDPGKPAVSVALSHDRDQAGHFSPGAAAMAGARSGPFAEMKVATDNATAITRQSASLPKGTEKAMEETMNHSLQSSRDMNTPSRELDMGREK